MQNEQPPAIYNRFITTFPELGEAWETIGRAGRNGPLDERTQRLIKLAVAMGAMREGAVHASVRKARALGIAEAELRQVVSLAAGTMGLPSTVALFSWIEERNQKTPG